MLFYYLLHWLHWLPECVASHAVYMLFREMHWVSRLGVPDFHRVQAPLKWGGSTLRTKKSWVNIWPWRTLSTDTFLILFSKWAMNFSNRFCHVYMPIRLCLYISLYLVPPTQLVIAELEADPIVELLQEWVYMERSHLFCFGIVTVAATATATTATTATTTPTL